MKIAIICFDQSTDLDIFLLWDVLKRVRVPDWHVSLLGDQPQHTTQAGLPLTMHGGLAEARDADAVLFTSGPGTRAKMRDRGWLDQLQLDPARQYIGSICSGALLLAALGLLEGKEATTYPTAKPVLESFGVTVIEKPFVAHEHIATAGGCLAAQYLAGWVIEKLVSREWSELVLRSIQPVGAGLSFADVEKLAPLYAQPLAVSNHN